MTDRKKKRGRVGSVMIAFGIFILAAAAALYLYTRCDEARAENAAVEALEKIKDSVPSPPENTDKAYADSEASYTEATVNIDGVEYLGYIEFVGYDITLPVIADWSFDSMQNAPVRYKGSIATDDIIIAGHNYDSHFNLLNRLVVDNEIIFTDAVGHEIHYLVCETEILQPTAIDQMESGTWDMTLFTCTSTGQTRATVRCKRITKDFGLQ